MRHFATSRKAVGWIPDGIIGIFHWHNSSGRIMALGFTQPMTKRRGTARTLPKFLFRSTYCLFCVVLCILCVCKCVLYWCHRVATQLQLTNISYQMSTRNIFWGVKTAGACGEQPYHFRVPIVLKSVEPQPLGSLRACPGL